MDKQDVIAFKKELENYSYYKTNLEGTKKLIEYNEYLLSNLHGIDPSREPSGSSGSIPWVETESFRRIADELDRLNKRKVLREAQIEHIENVLNAMDSKIKDICIEIYLDGKSYREVASNRGISSTSLFRTIEEELKEIL